jgi:simple sugar transport system permease protein
MASESTQSITSPATAAGLHDHGDRFMPVRRSAEMLAISALAVGGAAAIFSVLLLALGVAPGEFFELLWRGGFGTWFSLQNTLVRAAPLVFTALAVAIPAQLGLVVIGGEGALVLGGFAAACAALPFGGGGAPALVTIAMVAAALASGAAWIGAVGALRHFRGVNETISSLLMSYLAIAVLNFFVEGPLRDPASPIKSSTRPIGDANMVGNIPGTSVHWGLAASVVLAIAAWVLMRRTTFGFAARLTGGNLRAARAQGLPVGRLIVAACALAGACAGLAGYFEVAAVQGRANASLAAGYGFSGILVSFLARHHALAIVPVAILVGGISASGGLIQRRLDLPDATVLLLQGTLFVVLLVSETLYGRFAIFRAAARGVPDIDGNP